MDSGTSSASSSPFYNNYLMSEWQDPNETKDIKKENICEKRHRMTTAYK